jgi:flagellar basal-body rod modification protein FlgD
MQVAPVTSAPASSTASSSASGQTGTDASSAYGLSFESLLRIILTQLTYQDPLKPMDNFEFVSQLAQFSQLQIGQTGNDRLQSIVSAQAGLQSTGLLGKQVDIGTSAQTLTGVVRAIAFDGGEPRLTIETTGGQTLSGISLGSVSQIREAN